MVWLMISLVRCVSGLLLILIVLVKVIIVIVFIGLVGCSV